MYNIITFKGDITFYGNVTTTFENRHSKGRDRHTVDYRQESVRVIIAIDVTIKEPCVSFIPIFLLRGQQFRDDLYKKEIKNAKMHTVPLQNIESISELEEKDISSFDDYVCVVTVTPD